MSDLIAQLPPRIATILTPKPTDPEFTEGHEVLRIWLTPPDADYLRQYSRSLRKPSPKSLAQLVELKQKGLMPSTGETIILDAQGQLIDGLKRVESISITGKGEWVYVAVGINPLANRVIGHGSRRSFKDTLLFERTSGHAKLVAAAIGYITSWEFRRNLTSNAQSAEWQRWQTHEKHPEIEQFAPFYNTNKTPIGITASVCLAMHVILHEVNPGYATEFMDSLMSEARAGTPVGALASLVKAETDIPQSRRKQNLHSRLGYAIGVTWNLQREDKQVEKPIKLPAMMPELVA